MRVAAEFGRAELLGQADESGEITGVPLRCVCWMRCGVGVVSVPPISADGQVGLGRCLQLRR